MPKTHVVVVAHGGLMDRAEATLAAARIGVRARCPAWKDRTSWFLVGEEDRMISLTTALHGGADEGARAHVSRRPRAHGHEGISGGPHHPGSGSSSGARSVRNRPVRCPAST
jgi:hypothetical protein